MNVWSIVRRILSDSGIKVTGLTPLSAQMPRTRQSICRTARQKSSKSDAEGFEELDKPIKFTTSKAADWSAQQTFTGSLRPDTPWFQPYAVVFSTAAILIYFCVLREENDLDEEMSKPIWQRIPGLELQQLQVVYDYNKEHGLDNKEVVARMEQLQKENAVAAATSRI